MIELILLGALAALAWRFFSKGTAFVPGFATLLEQPVIARRGFRSYLSGVEQVGGDYLGRPVVLVLHHKRGDDLGYLIVGMEAMGTSVPDAENSGVLRDWIHDPDALNALDDLELRYKLKLSLEDAWLKATWMPIGFFIFPGRFDKDRWHHVLRAMHRVARSLEESASRMPRGGS